MPQVSPAKEPAGLLLVDKPVGVTSHDVVDAVRRIYKMRRVGHAGTLDPIAQGLLVLMLGEATKLAEYLQGADKHYEGAAKLGVESDTYDCTGNVVPGPGGPIPALEDLQEIADELTGTIDQIPPRFSAKKVAGRRLYDYARAGEEVAVDARRIEVRDFELYELEGDTVEFGVECSSGTYVRSLVHDLGKRAGCGAVLTVLRRMVVGSFDVDDAHTLESLEARQSDPAALRELLIPIRRAVPTFPALHLAAGAEAWLRRGQAIPANMVELGDHRTPARGSHVILCRVMGEAVGIARVDAAPLSPPPKAFAGAIGPWYQPIKLFEIDDDAAADGPPAP